MDETKVGYFRKNPNKHPTKRQIMNELVEFEEE